MGLIKEFTISSGVVIGLLLVVVVVAETFRSKRVQLQNLESSKIMLKCESISELAIERIEREFKYDNAVYDKFLDAFVLECEEMLLIGRY